MAWANNAAPGYSGGHNDKDAETYSASVGVVTVSRQTTRVNTGAGGLDIDLTTNSNVGCVRWGQISQAVATVKLVTFRGFFGLDVAPSSEAALMYAKGATTAVPVSGGKTMVGIGTDRALYFRDKNGVQHGQATSTLIPTAGLQEVTIIYDGVTLASVFIIVIMGTTVERLIDTGLAWDDFWSAPTDSAIYLGEALPAANRGCHIYADDVTSERSVNTPGDAPHLVAYPRLLVSEPQIPTAGSAGVGNWPAANFITGTGTTFAEIDAGELPPHDGDGSYLQSTTASQKYLVSTTNTNPITGISATVRRMQAKDVSRRTGSDKLQPNFLMRISGTEGTASPSADYPTTYVGNAYVDMGRPGGGSWTDADLDASVTEWGHKLPSSSAGLRVTLNLGLEALYYTASHGLTTTPTSNASIFLRRKKPYQNAALTPFAAPLRKPWIGVLAQPAVVVAGRRKFVGII